VDHYTYDENGNTLAPHCVHCSAGVTCRVENGVTYKHDYNTDKVPAGGNRISAIHKVDGDCDTGTLIESWVFAYDGDGVRTTTVHYTGTTPDSSTFYYFGGAYEVIGTNVRKYYFFAGQMVAVRACPSGTCSGLNYLLTDHPSLRSGQALARWWRSPIPPGGCSPSRGTCPLARNATFQAIR
jgi:hypothetical protein